MCAHAPATPSPPTHPPTTHGLPFPPYFASERVEGSLGCKVAAWSGRPCQQFAALRREPWFPQRDVSRRTPLLKVRRVSFAAVGAAASRMFGPLRMLSGGGRCVLLNPVTGEEIKADE